MNKMNETKYIKPQDMTLTLSRTLNALLTKCYAIVRLDWKGDIVFISR